MLRACIANAEFATFLQFSEDFAEKHGMRVIRNKPLRVKTSSLGTILKSSLDLIRCALWRLLHKRFSLIAKALVNTRELKEYTSADIIIDVSMDLYSDDYGLITVVEHSKDILLGVLLRKPVVVWAQSPGPFRAKLTSWLVRIALNKVTLITVREEISLEYLRELGVDVPPIHVVADPAFILQAASQEKAKEILSSEGIDTSNRPLIGMTMSWSILTAEARKSRYLKCMESAYRAIRLLLPERLFEFMVRWMSHFKPLDMSNYAKLEVMTEIVDYLAEKLGATVVLIPHDKEPNFDDVVLAGEILRRVKQRERVRLISGDYSAPELKAVIGQCDLFIGGKMHATIAATSMYVPTVAIQYSHKFSGIMRMLGQEDNICHGFNIEEVKTKIDEAWTNRAKVRAELEAKIGTVKERAVYNAELVAELLDSRRPSNVSS